MLNTLGKKLILTTAIAGTVGLFIFAQMQPSQAKDAAFDAGQTEAIQGIIKDYLMTNPQVIFDSIDAFRTQEEEKKQADAVNAIKDNITKLTSADAPSIGPDDADVTIVEFFDFNCGYCKRALPDVQSIAKNDKKVRFVFKEMPILGPTSLTAAQWAVAAHKQGKYFEYHSAVMEHNGPKDEEVLAKIAQDLGLDIDQMKKDAASPEVQAMIDADVAMAQAIGINGTPAFIVGEKLYPGYIGEDGMLDAIKEERAAQ